MYGLFLAGQLIMSNSIKWMSHLLNWGDIVWDKNSNIVFTALLQNKKI